MFDLVWKSGWEACGKLSYHKCRELDLMNGGEANLLYIGSKCFVVVVNNDHSPEISTHDSSDSHSSLTSLTFFFLGLTALIRLFASLKSVSMGLARPFDVSMYSRNLIGSTSLTGTEVYNSVSSKPWTIVASWPRRELTLGCRDMSRAKGIMKKKGIIYIQDHSSH